MNVNNKVWLEEQPDNSIDHIITDPPYLINFMGKKWDKANSPAGDPEFWKECLRVVKPGGYCLAFGHSRQHHRVMVALEDAGWDVRDCLMWLYGQGFPKSHEMGIKLDKHFGKAKNRGVAVKHHNGQEQLEKPKRMGKHEPITPEAKRWSGWGNALKPAYEPIIMARKPYKGSLVKNVLEWDVGALNIDECRVGTKTIVARQGRFPANVMLSHNEGCKKVGETVEIEEAKEITTKGPKFSSWSDDPTQTRWHNQGFNKLEGNNYTTKGRQQTIDIYECEEGCPVKKLDEQAPRTGGGHHAKTKVTGYGKFGGGTQTYEGPGEKLDGYGGASRFFYCPKVNKKERNLGCADLPDKDWFKPGLGGSVAEDGFSNKHGQGTVRGISKNNHPTVKPQALMEWLIKLVSQEGHVILDPFAGSGSTGMACAELNRNFVGVELDPDYSTIAKRRINYVRSSKKNK